MPKITTGRIITDQIEFSYNINVNSEGIFNTTIPKEAAEKIESVGIKLDVNRVRNSGYFEAKDIQSLRAKVNAVIEEYRSSKIIEEGIIIRYSIGLSCNYCMDGAGRIMPNCEDRWGYRSNTDLNWHTGNTGDRYFSRDKFGFQVYARPFYREIKQRRNGEKHTEYRRLTKDEVEEGLYLDLLNCFKQNDPYQIDRAEGYKDIPYTEEAAKFFSDMLIGICEINEKVKDFLEPDKIQLIIDSKQRFLGG